MDSRKFNVDKIYESVFKSVVKELMGIDKTDIDIYKLCDIINNMDTKVTINWTDPIDYIGDTKYNLGHVDKLITELKKRIMVIDDLFSFAFAFGISTIKRKDRVEKDIINGRILYGEHNLTDLTISFVMLDLVKINSNQDNIIGKVSYTYKNDELKVKSRIKKIKVRR